MSTPAPAPTSDPPTVTPQPDDWRTWLGLAVDCIRRLNHRAKRPGLTSLAERHAIYRVKHGLTHVLRREGLLVAVELERYRDVTLRRYRFELPDGFRFEWHLFVSRPSVPDERLPPYRARPSLVVPWSTPHMAEHPAPAPRRYTAAQQQARTDAWLDVVRYVIAAERCEALGLAPPDPPRSCRWVPPDE